MDARMRRRRAERKRLRVARREREQHTPADSPRARRVTLFDDARDAPSLRRMAFEQHASQTVTLADYRELGRSDADYVADLLQYIMEEAEREGNPYAPEEVAIIRDELQRLADDEAIGGI